MFVGHFCPPVSGSGYGSRDPIESGSTTLVWRHYLGMIFLIRGGGGLQRRAGGGWCSVQGPGPRLRSRFRLWAGALLLLVGLLLHGLQLGQRPVRVQGHRGLPVLRDGGQRRLHFPQGSGWRILSGKIMQLISINVQFFLYNIRNSCAKTIW